MIILIKSIEKNDFKGVALLQNVLRYKHFFAVLSFYTLFCIKYLEKNQNVSSVFKKRGYCKREKRILRMIVIKMC